MVACTALFTYFIYEVEGSRLPLRSPDKVGAARYAGHYAVLLPRCNSRAMDKVCAAAMHITSGTHAMASPP